MDTYDRVRAQLRARLGDIVGRIDRIERDLRRTPDRDWTEEAVLQENDEVLEGLDELQHAEALEIRTALRRLDSGTYGTCARCGADIGATRLEALPTTDCCIACADHRAASATAGK
jgi:RNA polymerase-binding transcription factor DksA